MPGAVNGAVVEVQTEREPFGIEIPPTDCEPAGNARSTIEGTVNCPALALAKQMNDAPNDVASDPPMEMEEPVIVTVPLPPLLQVMGRSWERVTVVMLLWFVQFKDEPAVIDAWNAPTSAPPDPLNE